MLCVQMRLCIPLFKLILYYKFDIVVFSTMILMSYLYIYAVIVKVKRTAYLFY